MKNERKKISVVVALLCCVVAFGVLSLNVAKADAGYVLQYNEFVEKPEWAPANNCYAYAIDRYKTDIEKLSEVILEPGLTCGKEVFETVEELAESVKGDLVVWKCDNIVVGTNLEEMLPLGAREKLVCFRMETRGSKDYHFMRYNNDGYWYHKPGNTGILRYNPQDQNLRKDPSKADYWLGEYAMSASDMGVFEDEELPVGEDRRLKYDSQTYFIKYRSYYCGEHQMNGIKSADDFEELRKHPTYDWALCNDVSLYSVDKWEPIENFSGDFYGNDNAISDLKYRGSAKEKIGLFGTLKGKVMNLKIRSAEITITGDIDLSQTINIGAIAAINEGSISKCEAGAYKNYSVTVGSNTMANIGGICGVNYGPISECNVKYFTGVATGNIGGITGSNYTGAGCITNCNVYNSELHIYAGNVGGITGYNDSGFLQNCHVIDTNISCYNGFPSTSAKYYSSNHYGRAGGISGYNSESETSYKLDNCSISNVKLSTGNESVDSSHGGRSFAPEIGFICGNAKANRLENCTYDASSTVTGNNLHTETWGFWPWEKGSWDQAQYVGSRLIGHSL